MRVLGWAAIVAAALGLRLFQLSDQILIDDELHALVKLSTTGYRGIASSLGLADHSIPLTLFYKWVAEAGRLSEAWMLGLPWIAGVGAVMFATAVALRRARRDEAMVFAALLAVSPLLVLYTRQARPYAITLALGLVAVWAAWRWWRTGQARYVALHLACGVAAVYFHMIVMPFVFGPWVLFLVAWLAGERRDGRRLAQVIGIGALAGAMSAALLGPAIVHDWADLRQKGGVDNVTAYSLWRTAHLVAGTTSAWLVVMLGGLAAYGTRILWVREPEATRFMVALCALHLACVLVSGALWLNHALVLSRYLLLLMPPLLLAAAVGLTALVSRLPVRSAWPAALVPAGFVLGLFATGPLPGALAYPNAFFGHYVYFVDVDPAHNEVVPFLEPGPVPAFYRELGKRPAGSVRVIEAPWRFESMFNRQPYFQRVHRQKVAFGMVGGLCPPGGAVEHPRSFRNKFRHFVDLARPVDELRRKGDYVVFHRALDLANMTKPWMSYGGRALPPAEACIAHFRATLGAPVFEDETITVFALRP